MACCHYRMEPVYVRCAVAARSRCPPPLLEAMVLLPVPLDLGAAIT
jgi:hypothetical protein